MDRARIILDEPSFIQHTLLAVYVALLLIIAFYGLHRYILVYLYIKYRNTIYQPKSTFTQLPRVTVQLPMFNEHTVAERVIRATCLIDYPLDRLEIQVLDDSTDESADIARTACEQWAAKGYPIKYIHRTNRVGYKAGALADAMPGAQRANISRSSMPISFRRATFFRTSFNTSPTTKSVWSRFAGTI